PIRADTDERAGEVAEGLSNEPRGRRDALRDVAVDPDAGRVHEDPPVDFADVDGPAARIADEPGNVTPAARVSERAREVVARPDRIKRERSAAAGDSVRDLVRGPVATGRDDDAVPIGGAFARESRRLVGRRCLNDVDAHALIPKLSRDTSRDPPARTVPGNRVHDGERAFVRLPCRAGHAPAGESALRMASCSSSDSACLDRPACTGFAKMRVSARPWRLDSTTPLPAASSRATAKDWSPPV